MIKYILFDLDGTLLDTREGIISSAEHTFSVLGRPVPDEKRLNDFIGPPLIYSFTEFGGLNQEEAENAIKIFRQRYTTLGVDEFTFFEDIGMALKELSDKGYVLAVATSKLEWVAKVILEKAGLTGYFMYIGGADDSLGRKSKEQVIEYVLEALSVRDKEEVLMVGDRSYDVEGAHLNGIKCAGVLCGYGSREEFEACGADYVINYVSDLVNNADTY